MMRRVVGTLISGLVVASTAAAQMAKEPAIRPIGPIDGVTKDAMSSVTTAVPVKGGVFVNDITARRLMLFDSTFTKATVVLDSTGDAANSYGSGPRTAPGTLIPFHGDSVLFISPSSLSMLVIDASGKIVRTMAMPSGGGQGGIAALVGNIFGTPRLDAQGRLVYFANRGFQFNQTVRGGGAPQPGPTVLEPPDSAALVRYDFAKRSLDTAAFFKIPKSRTTLNRSGDGPIAPVTTAFPLQTVDDWAVLPSGEVAVVRGRDYHVDWLGADGKWTSTPRMAFDWEHLSDEQKGVLLDSAVAAQQVLLDSLRARMERALNGGAGGNGAPVTVDSKGGAGGGGATMVIVTRGDGGGDHGGGGGSDGPRRFSAPKFVVARAELNDVPDYRPVFGQGATLADADGNLWIRTSLKADARPVYDVVDRRGEVTDRVQLPANRTIAGFGKGVVYMGVIDSANVAHLERARIHQIGMVAGK